LHSGVPEEIEYPRFVSTDYAQREVDRIPLVNGNGVHLWAEHPVRGSKVDVAAIEVPQKNEKGHVVPISYSFYGVQYEQTQRCEMASRLSIIGFPIAKRPTGFFPIWIQATVASEMDLGYNGERGFLVDALTSKGMSGSPVFRQESETDWTFLGVYSGRIKEGDVELPLGIVWRREVIFETILRLAVPEQFGA
jgi:hypothetical protein